MKKAIKTELPIINSDYFYKKFVEYLNEKNTIQNIFRHNFGQIAIYLHDLDFDKQI